MPDDRGNSGFFSINSRDGGNNSTPSSNAPPSNENPLLAYYRQWSSQTPLLSKNLLLIVFIIYLFSFFFPLDLMFSNIPILTLKYFQIYRVVFSSFVGNSILTLLLLLFFFPQLSARMEFASGTFQYFFTIMMLSVVTNVLFVVICVIFSMMGIDSAMYWSCSGIWVVIFALITIDCLREPEAPRQFMFIPVNIPSKYMPLILYLMVSLFSGFLLDYFLAMVVGYLHHREYLNRFIPSNVWFQDMETSVSGTTLSSSGGVCSSCFGSMLRFFMQFEGYVKSTDAMGFQAFNFAPVQTREDMMEGQGNQASSAAPSHQFFSINSRNSSTPSSSSAPSSSSSSSFLPSAPPSSWASLGGSNGSSSTAQSGTTNPMFPGSGKTLSTSGSGVSSFSSFAAGNNTSAAQASKEEILAKRLQAFGNNHGSSTSTSSSTTSSRSNGSSSSSSTLSGKANAGATKNSSNSNQSSMTMPGSNSYNRISSNSATLGSTTQFAEELSMLQEMGFRADQAEIALQNANGDVELAIQILSSQP